MLKVAVPSNTSDPPNASSNSTPSTPDDLDDDGSRSGSGSGSRTGTRMRKKKRRWSICAAKVRAGALKVRALVTSDSSSSSEGGDEGGNDSESEMDSDSGADSGFGEEPSDGRDYDRPRPLKVRQRVPQSGEGIAVVKCGVPLQVSIVLLWLGVGWIYWRVVTRAQRPPLQQRVPCRQKIPAVEVKRCQLT